VRKLSFLLLLFTYLSCSSIDQGRPLRSPASIAQVFNSCKKGIKNIFEGTTKKKIKATLLKLEDGTPLLEVDAQRLLKVSYEIPFSVDRQGIEQALKKGTPLNKKQINTIRNFIGRDIMLGHNTDPSLYKRLHFGGDESFPITFGLEFELRLEEVPGILNSYRLKTLSEQQWYSLSLEERLKLALEAQKKNNDIEDILIRLEGANPALPKGLFPEPHGTLEGNNIIYDNLGELHELVSYMSEHFGKFSWQPHVVVDANAEFKGMAGYTLFEFDRNQLKTLENGYQRYLRNPEGIPSANLVHYSLGPVDEKIAVKLRESDDYLENGIMEVDTSGVKAVSAPHFRVEGPYGKGKMGFELRQFHKRYTDMFDALTKLGRDMNDLGSLGHYGSFKKADQVSKDTIKNTLSRYMIPQEDIDDFELFFLALSDEILKYNRAMGGGRSGADYEHRLLYPLRNWLEHPIRESLGEVEKEAFDEVTKTAQLKFISQVKELMLKNDVTEVDSKTLEEVRILIAEWAHQSNYSRFFESFSDTIKGEKRDLHYSYLPDIKFFDEIGEKSYKFKQATKNISYENYLDNTIEVAFRDIGKTGHMELRVGQRHYSINGFLMGSTSTSSKDFTGFASGTTGRVYRLDRNKIKEAMEQVEAFIKSAKKNNFPPFDIWGSNELVEPVKGGFKMVESKNKALIKATIEQINGTKYFVNGSVKIPVVEIDDQIYIRTTNCTRGVTDILTHYLDFDIGPYASAGMLDNAFKKGSIRKPIDLEVHY
jgi:hypothetical protein